MIYSQALYASNRDGLSVSYHRESPDNRWEGHAGGRMAPPTTGKTLQSRGGPGRNHSKCMELQLTKVIDSNTWLK